MCQELVYMRSEEEEKLRKFWVWSDNTAREIHPTGLGREMIDDFYSLYKAMQAEGYREMRVPMFAR